MDTLVQCYDGLDVHKSSIVACIRLGGPKEERGQSRESSESREDRRT